MFYVICLTLMCFILTVMWVHSCITCYGETLCRRCLPLWEGQPGLVTSWAPGGGQTSVSQTNRHSPCHLEDGENVGCHLWEIKSGHWTETRGSPKLWLQGSDTESLLVVCKCGPWGRMWTRRVQRLRPPCVRGCKEGSGGSTCHSLLKGPTGWQQEEGAAVAVWSSSVTGKRACTEKIISMLCFYLKNWRSDIKNQVHLKSLIIIRQR